MLLIRRSRRAAKAVRSVSSGGELLVASVVVCLLVSAFGDAIDVTVAGEGGVEFMPFDFSGELALLAMSHWNLVHFLLAGSAVAAGVSVLSVASRLVPDSLRSAPVRAIEKVPIRL